MTKKKAIIKRIKQEAQRQGLQFLKAHRKGGNHDVYLLDGLMIPIPRLIETTTIQIYKECEEKLGEGWYRQ